MTRKFAVKPITDENLQAHHSVPDSEQKLIVQPQLISKNPPKVELTQQNKLKKVVSEKRNDTSGVKRLFKFYADSELRDIIKTVAQLHPNYKNATQFIVECMELGYKEHFHNDYVVEDHRTQELPDLVKQMLKDFLEQHSLDDLLTIKGKKVTINFNIEDEFLTNLRLALIKSKKYNSELQNFSTNQIYIGLKTMVL